MPHAQSYRNAGGAWSATMVAVGYDLTLMDLPSDLNDLRQVVYWEPDGETLRHYSEAVEPYRLHLNIAAMGFCRKRMAEFRMLAGGTHEPFPCEPTRDGSMYGSAREHRAANPDAWRAFEDAERRASSQRGEGPGIARFKLESNGPWIVVAEEVDEALSEYDRSSAAARAGAEADEVWATWIAWLRRANRGFEVN